MKHYFPLFFLRFVSIFCYIDLLPKDGGDRTLSAMFITVSKIGQLHIGSAEKPFSHTATIKMYTNDTVMFQME